MTDLVCPPFATALFTMLCGVGCCGSKTSRPPPDAEVPITEPGGCRNVDAAGECRFLGLSALNVAGPEGTKLVRVTHSLASNGETYTLTSATLRIPDDREADLQRYYEEHNPTHCTAYIIFPPCNDTGTTVQLDVSPPSFATPERY